ncbi:LysR family transcriptional regulator [Paenibacillus rhizovicinus]|uniref:LysR family transcriptional regulator n=1 Tax=Paenibacillus rhizovicinus TaxID=2704463 RepID=A0A6C0NW65_9BACL|nr:LysR family transcriptional regulator [Paenibacillus rhizovicinus]QHW29963.1 LysR family transcriptional regulator [Paenibacillus rhizovicinus]
MNLYGLIVFHHVAATGSVTKAAEALRISQPAVTAHVRNMAAELGLTLLAPKGRGILLTEAGERLAAHAARLFSLQEEILRDMGDYVTGAAGELRLAATSLPANFLLPERLAAYRAAFPGVNITLQTLNADNAIQALLRYEADAAIIGGGVPEQPGLTRQLLLEDELWFVAASGHALAGKRFSIAALMNEAFVMREPGSAAREQLLTLCRIHGAPPPKTALQVSGVHESLHAAASGLGVTFVSSMEARSAVARGELVRLRAEGIDQRNPILLFTRAEDALPPVAEQFIALLASWPNSALAAAPAETH